MRLSVIIPARNETHLVSTIRDLLAHAIGDLEIIPVLDGYHPDLPGDLPMRPLWHTEPVGMRPSINEAVIAAKGEYILKCDAHCSFAPGFDQVLIDACEPGSLVVPARYELDVATWTPAGDPITAHYLSWPFAKFKTESKRPQWHGRPWWDRMKATAGERVSNDMTIQGSCWLMRREDFVPLDSLHYGTFVQEPEELCLGAWFRGGQVRCAKATWYAHWRKREGQGYIRSHRQTVEGMVHSLHYHLYDQRAAFRAYMARFWPVPGWPEDWEAQAEAFRLADFTRSLYT